MSNDTDNGNQEELAGQYVLGTLDYFARDNFERSMVKDASLRKMVSDWQDHLQPLAETAPAMSPSSDLLNNILAAIDGKPQPGSTTVRKNEGEWLQLAEGVYKKILYVDETDQIESFLLKLEAGAVCPAHSHTKTEECIMLEGEMKIGEARFSAGDYHAVPPDIPHLPISSEFGATMFIRAEL